MPDFITAHAHWRAIRRVPSSKSGNHTLGGGKADAHQERVVKFRLICFLVLIASLRKKKNNVLRLLLTLECVVLFLFIVLCFLGEIYFSVIFLRVGACEAAVGLGCLVGLIRLAGQNHISFMECGRYAPHT